MYRHIHNRTATAGAAITMTTIFRRHQQRSLPLSTIIYYCLLPPSLVASYLRTYLLLPSGAGAGAGSGAGAATTTTAAKVDAVAAAAASATTSTAAATTTAAATAAATYNN